MAGGGGGGDRSPLPASKGRLPKVALRAVHAAHGGGSPISTPSSRWSRRIIGPPDIRLPNVNMSQYGDPLAKIGPPRTDRVRAAASVGQGRRYRIRKGRGFGPGEGGGIGGGVFRVGGGVTAPSLLYKVEPEYSEEARKAKYQGIVLLYVEVDRQRPRTEHARAPQPGTRPG